MKSTAPPKNPEHRPIATPMVIVTAIAATPTVSEMRAPKMMRESTSRPSSSVPIGNAREGAPGSPKVGGDDDRGIVRREHRRENRDEHEHRDHRGADGFERDEAAQVHPISASRMRGSSHA